MTEDNLIPAQPTQQRYGVSAMTLHRWLKDEKLGFPKPIIINKRRYWRVSELVEWERSRAAGRAA